MRLYELIDYEPKKSNITAHTNMSRILNKTRGQEVGGGAFGSVYDTQSNKRLNQVTKVGNAGSVMSDKPAANIKQDGWLSYMQAVHRAQQHGEQNPYFPIMHDLHIRRAANGKLSYSANLQKLIPINSPKLTSNIELMQAVYERMFGVECPFNTWLDILHKILDNIKMGENLSDPDLISAMKLINSVIDASGDAYFIKDMHEGNIMWRLTGTMPHLVIIDPIA